MRRAHEIKSKTEAALDEENAVDGPMLAELSEEELCSELGLLKLQAPGRARGSLKTRIRAAGQQGGCL